MGHVMRMKPTRTAYRTTAYRDTLWWRQRTLMMHHADVTRRPTKKRWFRWEGDIVKFCEQRPTLQGGGAWRLEAETHEEAKKEEYKNEWNKMTQQYVEYTTGKEKRIRTEKRKCCDLQNHY